MAVNLKVTLDQLLDLVNQLSNEEKRAFLDRLERVEADVSEHEHELTFEERRAMLQSMIITTPLDDPWPLSREAWYGDDGR